jgi:predicted DNA-binding transcriptional regulator AlpA
MNRRGFDAMGEPTGDYWDSINGTGRVRLMTAEQVASARMTVEAKRREAMEREADYLRLRAECAAHRETNQALVAEVERLRKLLARRQSRPSKPPPVEKVKADVRPELPERLWNVRDVARVFRVTEGTIGLWVRSGRFPVGVKIGRSMRWDPRVVQRHAGLND